MKNEFKETFIKEISFYYYSTWKIFRFNNGGYTRNLFIDNSILFLTDLDDSLEILEISNIPPTQNPSFIIPVIITFSILGVILIISVIFRLIIKRKV
ncbi:MAG: hypothetical protein ACFFBE_07780 [Promethearchaeota archaeon]